MSHHNNSIKSGQSSEENQRRVDQLINLVERETRTERHMEQNSDISDPENLKNAEKVQQNRREEIDHLKNVIVNGEHGNSDQEESLKKRYEYTDGYLEHNAEHMDEEALVNPIRKQEHRREQLDSFNP